MMARKKKEDTVADKLMDELLKDYSTPEEILGENGLLKQLSKRLIERALKGELSYYLEQNEEESNSRNGYSDKTIQSSQGEMTINVPRDRKSNFEPILVPKREKRIQGLDEKILGLYARGMSTRDIQEQIEELYGVNISAGLVSQITAEVKEDIREWQNRPLEAVYPIVWLDGLRVNIRHEGRVSIHVLHVAMGVNIEGHKEVLGLWLSEGGEGAKFWLSVLNEIRNRGVQEIFITCIDGLKGFPEAIAAVFPEAKVQRCIVHLVRNSLNYVSYKDRKEVAASLKTIYQSATVPQAEHALTEFAQKWDPRYPAISQLWFHTWEYIIPFFDYPPDIRRVIYTTNAIESLNRSFRKVIKTKGVFPSQDSLLKLLYLALQRICRKWTMPIPHWKAALACFAIEHPNSFLF
jgi:transposase-like protein